MIVADSSALVAILAKEPEADRFSDMLLQEDAAISAATLVETTIVAMSRGMSLDMVTGLIAETGTHILALDEATALAAIAAFQTYGKGRGHKARLNFGDCLAYAAAKRLGAALLYKGDDFAHTDLPRA